MEQLRWPVWLAKTLCLKTQSGNKMVKAEDLRNTWRIILLVIVGQLIGILFGFTIELHAEPFFSLWIGGAFGTLPGFLLGIFWHFSNPERRKAIPYFTVGVFAIGAIVLPFAAFNLLTGGIGYMKLVSNLQALTPSTISSLSIYKGYDNSKILTITDKKQLTSFIESCSDLQNNYTQYNSSCNETARYYIGLNGALPKDIILEYCQSNVAKGVFAIREGKTTSFHGTFTSTGLKKWLSENVAPTFGD